MKDKTYKIISCIILSIISAAIWEKIISPHFNEFMNYILSFGNKFITIISNLIYTRIATGIYINIPYFIFMIIMSFLILVWLIEIYCVYKLKRIHIYNEVNKKEQIKQDNKINVWLFKVIYSKYLLSVYTAFIILFYLFFFLITNFINDTITKVTNNIEIISPYIDDYNYKMLKSKFYLMTSRKDYEDLTLIIDKYGNEFGITLK